MAAVFEKTFFQNLQGNLIIRYCPEIVFSKDNLSNEITVKLYNGESEYSGGGTVSATVIRADGRTVPLTGTLTGNVVSLALIESCMEVPGQIQIFIRLTSGNVKTTVFAGVFTAVRTETDTVIDPGTIIPSVTDLINQIDAAIDSIPADYSTLLGSVAGTYSASKTYAVGDYVWYNGQLYRCSTAITTAESWTAAHWSSAVLGEDISVLKSALLSYTSVTSKTGELATGSISASGKINAGTTDQTLYYYLVDGLASVIVNEGDVYGFYANAPSLGSVAVDSTRHVGDLYYSEISIISGAKYLAVRSSADKAPQVFGKGSIQQNVSALNDEIEYINTGIEPIVGTWVAGQANTSGGVSTKRNSIAINSIVSYNRPITIYVDNGYMFFLRYYANNEFVSNSNWITDSIYVPSGQQFMITVQKSPEDLSDYAKAAYGKNIHVSTAINQRLINLEATAGNPWIGKKWVGFGTSITDITQAMPDGETGEVTGKYPAYLQALSGLLYTNYAVGGSTMCNMDTMSKATVIEQIDLAIQNNDLQIADIITIEGFINDWYHQSAIGNLDDTGDSANNDSTIYMAMHTAITKITTANPNALIAFIADSTGQSTWAYDQKRNGNYQYDFINAMRNFCNFAGCLFIDAGITSEINKFHPQYLADHAHHTYVGGEQFANAIWSVLKNHKPMVKDE